MASFPSRRLAALLLVPLAASCVLAGCSTSAPDKRPTIEPATPAVASATVPAAGTVVPAPAGEALTFDPVSRRLLLVGHTDLVLFAVDGGVHEVARIPLGQHVPAAAAQVAPNGRILVAANHAVLEVDAAAGTARTFAVDADARSVAALPDGRIVVGTSDGRVLVLGPDGDRIKTVSGLVEVDELLVGHGKVAAVDRRQAMLTMVDVDGGKLGDALRVGRGVTNATIDQYGRVLAVDTDNDQVIAYTVDPFMERFLYPVTGSPWAVDYDPESKLAWFTLTSTNQVVGYALGSGAPVEKQRHPTVRQPDAVTVDPKTGTLYVLSAAGDGVQVLPTR
jgi:hypothetical protein